MPKAKASSNADNPLKALLEDPDGLKFLLLTIQEIHDMSNQVQDNDHFVELFLEKAGHKGLSRRQAGGILAVLSRRNYIRVVFRGSKRHGFELAPAGWSVIRDETPARSRPSAAGVPAPAGPIATAVKDPTQVIVAFHSFAEQISGVGKRVVALKEREEKLLQELAQIRQEIVDLCPYVHDPEMLSLMQQLAEKQQAQPPLVPPTSDANEMPNPG